MPGPREEESDTHPPDAAVVDLLHGLLRRSHLTTSSELPGVVAEQAQRIGAHEVTLHVVDYELDVLVPLPRSEGEDAGPSLSVTGTVAGRAFSTTSTLQAAAEEPGLQWLCVPLIDGTERIGTMVMTFAEDDVTEDLVRACERYAHLVAILVVSKSDFGDTLERARRRRPMTIASELAWSLAPPMTFATVDLSLAGMFEPCYDNGGDALDYAVNGRTLHLAVFDAMGHGLAAAGVAAFAISAYRNSRRGGRDLLETHAAMHEAVGEQYPDSRFVTAIIAQLDLDSGRLRWVSAGHPPPLLIRGGRKAHTLAHVPVAPLGVDTTAAPEVAETSLEPGDLLLLYTDGLTEARAPDGSMFTVGRLSQFIEHEAAAGQTAPETLRRLRHAVMGRHQAELRDDATALLLEWKRGGEAGLLPATAA